MTGGLRLRLPRLITLAGLCCAVGGGRPALHHHDATRLSMGCAYAIEAYGPDPRGTSRALEEALDEVDRIDRLMSHYRADSPLSAINREAGRHALTVERELFDFIASALEYGRQTGGAFDITVGPLVKAWGFFGGEGRVPTGEALRAALRHVGLSRVSLDRETRTIRFESPGVELDLGGIAKGYAVDRAVARLRDRGIDAALLSACGSTLYGLGAPPGRDGWSVAIQDPLDPRRSSGAVELRDRALSIAGTSEKFFESDGVRYSHILDPRSGLPAQGVLGVVVMADTGTMADALDTAFVVLGPDRSRGYFGKFSGVAACFLLPEADRGWTSVSIGESRIPGLACRAGP
ncbi:MAG TPA: FAD:protein FMN transferase [Vicinamibacterales bacterium]|nr:FAD:protein FMN transferase [Vicinamibacterales bacterium]